MSSAIWARWRGTCGLTRPGGTVAEAIALFHDVGRFPQYARYKTFRDSISTNHAALGASVLFEQERSGSLPRRSAT